MMPLDLGAKGYDGKKVYDFFVKDSVFHVGLALLAGMWQQMPAVLGLLNMVQCLQMYWVWKWLIFNFVLMLIIKILFRFCQMKMVRS